MCMYLLVQQVCMHCIHVGIYVCNHICIVYICMNSSSQSPFKGLRYPIQTVMIDVEASKKQESCVNGILWQKEQAQHWIKLLLGH